MPSRASSSTSSPMAYDAFRPRFPLDPFTSNRPHTGNSNAHGVKTPSAVSARPPWKVDADILPSISPFLQQERRVILILGQPPPSALTPLYNSPLLSSSLLLIVSHRPPALPFSGSSFPSVHTLRLRAPLAVEDVGAPRLLTVLEWALVVAKLWRRAYPGTVPHVQELMEELTPSSKDTKRSMKLGGWGSNDGSSTNEINSFGRLRYSIVPDSSLSMPNSPSVSQNNIHEFPTSKSNISLASASSSVTTNAQNSAVRGTKADRRPSIRRFSFSKSSRRQSTLTVGEEENESERRPFDAIINFLPTEASFGSGDKERDKTILKSAILVTTLTRPYLTAPPDFTSSSSGLSKSKSRRASLAPEKSNKEGRKARRWTIFRGTSNNHDSALESATSSSTAVDGGTRNSASSREDEKSEGRDATQRREREILNAQLRSRRSRIIHVLVSDTPVILPSPKAYQSMKFVDSKQGGQAQARLIRSLEAFLLSFCFPVVHKKLNSNMLSPAAAAFSMSVPGINMSNSLVEADSKPARPYLVHSQSLGDLMSLPLVAKPNAEKDVSEKREWSLIELILCGALEGSDSRESKLPNGEEHEWAAHRAWIGSTRDIITYTNSGATDDIGTRLASSPGQKPVQVSEDRSKSKSSMPPDPHDKQVRPHHRRKVSPQLTAAIEKRLPTPPEEEEQDSESRQILVSEPKVVSASGHETTQTKLKQQEPEVDALRVELEKKERSRRDVERKQEHREKKLRKDITRRMTLERRQTEPHYETDSLRRNRERGHHDKRALGHEYEHGDRKDRPSHSGHEEKDYTGIGTGKVLTSQPRSRQTRTSREHEKNYETNGLLTPPNSQETILVRNEDRRNDLYEEERQHRHRELERARQKEREWEHEHYKRTEREERERRRSRSRARVTSDPSPSPSNVTSPLPSTSSYGPKVSSNSPSSRNTKSMVAQPSFSGHAPPTTTYGMPVSTPSMQASVSQDCSSCASISTNATVGSAVTPSVSTYSETPIYLATPTSLATSSLAPSVVSGPTSQTAQYSESTCISEPHLNQDTPRNSHRFKEHYTNSYTPHAPSPLSDPSIHDRPTLATNVEKSPLVPSKRIRHSKSIPPHKSPEQREQTLHSKRSRWRFWKALNSPIVGA